MVRGDHFMVCVVSNTREHLDAALSIAVSDTAKFTHYIVSPLVEDDMGDTNHPPALLFGHVPVASLPEAESHGCMKLPFALKRHNVCDFVWAWLEDADRGPEPSIDGTVKPDAFEVRALPAGAIAIIPRWSVYSK